MSSDSPSLSVEVRTQRPKSLAVVLCLFMSACTSAQQHSAQQSADDAFTAAQVRAKVAAVDPATLSLVHIEANSGVVTLSGQVSSEQERGRVVDAARGTAGVKRVINRLAVNSKAPTSKDIAGDMALQARVSAAIAQNTGVNAFRVHVSSHKGSVVLTGTVPTQPLHLVVLDSVRHVSGVRAVSDRLEVRP